MGQAPIDYDSIAEYYDLYVTASYDFAFFLEEAAAVRGPVLELTSGTGRLSLPLIEAGTQLTCVDNAPGMLRILEHKLQARGLQATVQCADVCTYRSETHFELAIWPFQSYMEIVEPESQQAALDAVYNSLRPGGQLICTLHNPTLRRQQVDGTLRAVGSFPIDDGTLVVTGLELGGQPIVERWQFLERYDSQGLLQEKRLLPMRFTLIEAKPFETMAKQAGFRCLDLYGSYDREPFDAASSPVMIWRLQRHES